MAARPLAHARWQRGKGDFTRNVRLCGTDVEIYRPRRARREAMEATPRSGNRRQSQNQVAMIVMSVRTKSMRRGVNVMDRSRNVVADCPMRTRTRGDCDGWVMAREM